MAQDGFLIGALLHFSSDELTRRVQEGYIKAGFADLRPACHPVLGLLRPEGDRVADLAKRAHTSKQAIGYVVSYLEECGYLERVPDPNDGRAQIVRRTERGWEVNRTARRLVEEIQQEWASKMGEDRMEALLVLLRELVSIIGVEYKGSVSKVSTRPK